MSIKIMNLVWGSTLEGTSKRFVLLALADRASDHGECSSLGVPTLCRKTGIKRSTMFGLLRELEVDDQLIQREEQERPNGSRKASRFWINLPLLTAMQRSDDDRDDDEQENPFRVSAGQPPVQKLDGARPKSGRGPVQNLDPLPVQFLDGGSPESGPLDPSEGERERDPSRDLSPSIDRGTEAGRPGPATPDRPAPWATDLVGRLPWAAGDDPTTKDRDDLALLVEAAVTDHGLTEAQLARHLAGKLGRAQANPVVYLRNALAPARLPAPRPEPLAEEPGAEQAPADVAPAKPALPACGRCGAYEGEPLPIRVLDQRGTPCPDCRPRSTTAVPAA